MYGSLLEEAVTPAGFSECCKCTVRVCDMVHKCCFQRRVMLWINPSKHRIPAKALLLSCLGFVYPGVYQVPSCSASLQSSFHVHRSLTCAGFSTVLHLIVCEYANHVLVQGAVPTQSKFFYYTQTSCVMETKTCMFDN